MNLRVLVMLLMLGLLSTTAQAVYLPQQMIPRPIFTAPAPGQKYTLTPTLIITLQASIPNVKTTLGYVPQTGQSIPGKPFDFVAYAKTSHYTEKWHVRLYKQQPRGELLLMRNFEGVIDGYQFSVSLNADWFKAEGAGFGKYIANAYLTQSGGLGTANGLWSGVDFEIAAPLSEKGPPPIVKPGQIQLPKLPDITSGTAVMIGGKSAAWGSSVTVDVKDAHSVNKNNSGLCEFAVKHSARNTGAETTGPFESAWTNSAAPGSFGRSWPPLAPGEMRDETDLVNLKPGQNILSLTLDNIHKVNESNEQNNQFRIVVNVSANCGLAPVAPQPRVSPALPPVVPQGPGDQTPQQAPPAPVQRRLNPPAR